MEDIKNLGEVFHNGGIMNFQKTSIIDLERAVEEIDTEEKNIKSKIFNILETF